MKIKVEGDIRMDDLVMYLWDYVIKKENRINYSKANAENMIRIGMIMLENLEENESMSHKMKPGIPYIVTRRKLAGYGLKKHKGQR